MFSTVCAALNVSANTCVSVNVFIMHQITSPSIHFLLLTQVCVTGNQPKQRCPDPLSPQTPPPGFLWFSQASRETWSLQCVQTLLRCLLTAGHAQNNSHRRHPWGQKPHPVSLDNKQWKIIVFASWILRSRCALGPWHKWQPAVMKKNLFGS